MTNKNLQCLIYRYQKNRISVMGMDDLIELLLEERNTLLAKVEQQQKYLDALNVIIDEEPEFNEEMGHT